MNEDLESDIYESSRFRDEAGYGFADPGWKSALRAASKTNPRNRRCSTCNHPNRLTPRDAELGYQCDSCANAMEGGWDIDHYEEDDE